MIDGDSNWDYIFFDLDILLNNNDIKTRFFDIRTYLKYIFLFDKLVFMNDCINILLTLISNSSTITGRPNTKVKLKEK